MGTTAAANEHLTIGKHASDVSRRQTEARVANRRGQRKLQKEATVASGGM